MDEENIPATEAQGDEQADEAAHYECAFHILPTVADGEVSVVVDALKAIVTHAGGTVTHDEIVPRYDLAYEIIKSVDGVSRRFNAAHFGWMRFTVAPAALPGITEEYARRPEILRHLVIKLTREEVEKPFSLVDLHKPEGEPAGDGTSGHEDAEAVVVSTEGTSEESREKVQGEDVA
ncbi:30S ribosomal protein S6 [Candidatus Kaiserbacteria bacterium]|nr:30S ribosomal protein S6 [Candidatus Kaiserbacteria bacterium]